MPVGGVKFRPHFDLELKCEVARIRKFDGSEVHVWLGDSREGAALRDLLQAVHNQAALDLVGNRLLESVLEKFSRDFSGSKARQVCFGRDLVERIFEVTIHFASWNGHHHMPLAGARLINLHYHFQLGIWCLGFRSRHVESNVLKGTKKGHNQTEKAGDGIRTHDNNVGNVVLYP